MAASARIDASSDAPPHLDPPSTSDRRIYVDGVFDLIHWGHVNALRQSYELGGKIVVGIVSDLDTYRAKGIYPIYNQEERAKIISGCKWVSEVMIGTPYDVSLNFLDEVAKCEIVAHGDDVAIGTTGKDCYEEPKNAGRLVHFKRTYGVSSTTTLYRLVEALESERFSHLDDSEMTKKGIAADFEQALRSNEEILINEGIGDHYEEAPDKKTVRFPRCRLNVNLLGKFITSRKRPTNGRIVYVDGSFDVFHTGHSQFLEYARKMGDYLIVGIYDDQTVRTLKGSPFPFTNLLDRALILLSMKHVDDVVLGAPYVLTESYIKNLGITMVLSGKSHDGTIIRERVNPYSAAEKLGILQMIDSDSDVTSTTIIKRVSSRLESIRDNIRRRYKNQPK